MQVNLQGYVTVWSKLQDPETNSTEDLCQGFLVTITQNKSTGELGHH